MACLAYYKHCAHRPTMLSFLKSLLLLCSLVSGACATKHSFETSHGKSLIGPVGVPFGYNNHGHFELRVFDFELKTKSDSPGILDRVEAGFFLKKFENEATFNQYMEELRSNATYCAFQHFREDSTTNYDDDGLDDYFQADDDEYENNGEILSAENGILLSMKSRKTWKPNSTSIDYRFKTGEAGLYFLIYQVCPYEPEIFSSFELDFHFCNMDSFGNENFLSAGEMCLPILFFFFSMSYLMCFVVWYTNIKEIQKGKPGHFASSGEQPIIYHIHQLMSLLLLLKFFSVFFESVRYHVIGITGHAELWTFVYYAVTFVKGTFLFTVILLIGTGWSFVKPFLNDREKKIILVILVLQVINNIAIIFLSQETEGETSYARWAGTLHIVDIVCCCAVLVPIVWQVNELEKSVGLEEEDVDVAERETSLESGDKGQILSKLKLFRSFYLVVVAYIYSTRILVFLFATLLDYKHLWVRHFVIEIVTLSFYVCVGLMFRPVSEKNYQRVVKDEDATEEGVELLAATNNAKKH